MSFIQKPRIEQFWLNCNNLLFMSIKYSKRWVLGVRASGNFALKGLDVSIVPIANTKSLSKIQG